MRMQTLIYENHCRYHAECTSLDASVDQWTALVDSAGPNLGRRRGLILSGREREASGLRVIKYVQCGIGDNGFTASCLACASLRLPFPDGLCFIDRQFLFAESYGARLS
jgi:hypothetical protein